MREYYCYVYINVEYILFECFRRQRSGAKEVSSLFIRIIMFFHNLYTQLILIIGIPFNMFTKSLCRFFVTNSLVFIFCYLGR